MLIRGLKANVVGKQINRFCSCRN